MCVCVCVRNMVVRQREDSRRKAGSVVVRHCGFHRQIEGREGLQGEEDVVNAQDALHGTGVNNLLQK